MKNKIVLFVFLAMFVSSLFAQTTEISSYKLNWKGIEKWVAGSASINVISFNGAQFPAENHLPYFDQRFPNDRNLSFQAELIHPVYAPLTVDEKILVPADLIPAQVKVQTLLQKESGIEYMNISILPFVSKDGKILKLLSFDLQITRSPVAQKVSGTALHTYAAHSVLAQGKFIKIKIKESGVYKLTFEDLNAMGINPLNVRIFGYGGGVLDQDFMMNKIDDLSESAIWMEKGTDGVFNAGDYILFYAQGINRWTYDATSSMFTHTANTYSDYGYYFVTSDAGTGKKIQDKTTVLPLSPVIHPIEEFVDYQVYEKDLINLANSGKEFYDETFKDVLSVQLPFTFPNPILTDSVVVRLNVAVAQQFNVSAFTLNLNGQQPKTLTVPKSSSYDSYEKAIGKQAVYSFAPQNDTFTFNLSYNKPTTYSIGYLNYLEVNVRRQLKMSGALMPFQNVDNLGTGSFNKYMLSSVGVNTQIWDITDPVNIGKMVTETVDGKITFVASGNDVNHYVALDPKAISSFPTPEIVGVVPNQDLHGIAQADMVIITHPDFVVQAETLAQAHRQKDNMTVAIVTTDQVYNEFSSGTPDATAYRWVMKMLYDRALSASNTAGMPKYLLLFGRGSYDNRKIRSDSGDNFILTYQADNSLVTTQSYVTDDYFTFLDDTEGMQIHSNLMDISVGRFPVTTVQQATDVVNKTIGYMHNTGKGIWKNQLCFMADDGDFGLHALQADTLAAITSRAGRGFQINKIYLDAYHQEVSSNGQSYPQARARLLNSIQSGLFLLNYTGHGFPTGLANEKVLLSSDIESMVNPHLPFWFVAACDFMQFDVQGVSAGEKVVLNPFGGGIGIIAAARPVYSSQNFSLNKLFNENLFMKVNGEQQCIGDMIRFAKNKTGQEINKLSFNYMGDPAVKLNYPTKYQVITGNINKNIHFGTDTLKALSPDTIQGFIADENQYKVKGFNGTVQAVIFDKIQQMNTFDNDNEFQSYEVPYTYSYRPDTLFSCKVPVLNGDFSFTFKLPLYLHDDYGSGRINYYAQDTVTDAEAQGYFENFIVGGTYQYTGVGIVNSPAPDSFSVSNFPNPVKDKTKIVVKVSHPENVIEAKVDIFDVSGSKIWSICQHSIDNLSWNLVTNSGQKVKAGIYLYQVQLKMSNGEIRSINNKMIVLMN